jgi:predicted dehydrogenase
MSQKRRYSLVGTGGRAVMFVDALADVHREHCCLASMCDMSQVRMDYYNRYLGDKHNHVSVPTFKPERFEEMIETSRPDVVIVCTTDVTHHEYILRAMDAGCDVICEKPMTVDAAKLQSIHDAMQRTGKSLRITFNLRYWPLASKVRELIVQGEIGRPMAVDFSYVMDTSHGADYFRRWHREKDKSGGLLVHKATHHFDLVNWWVNGRPRTVYAVGDLKFYGKSNAQSRGEHYDYDRYTDEARAQGDPFSMPLDGEDTRDFSGNALRSLYRDAEAETGYVRDRNVFGEGISIEDTMAVMARYDNGVVMNYSLVAYCPWEGFRLAITGDKGRLEIYVKYSSHIITGQSLEESAVRQEERLQVFPMFGHPYPVDVPKAEGGHGGGDSIMLDQLFSQDTVVDPLNRAASEADGAASVMVGVCANESMRTGLPVDCGELLERTRRAASE